MESRRLLTTFTVINTGDNGGVDPTPLADTGTFRQAIVDANASPGGGTIVFNIPTSDLNFSNGIYTITPASTLPLISSGVQIDGTTQAGFSATMHQPVIQLDGENAGASDGLHFNATTSGVGGITVNRFSQAQIRIRGIADDVTGCFVGTSADGKSALKPGTIGIEIESNSAYITIGGTSAADSDVIASGTQAGVSTSSSNTITIQGNYIGTDIAGDVSFGGGDGIDVTSGRTFTITKNTVAGNGLRGIQFLGTQNQDITITGNYIGTNSADSKTIGNKQTGILLSQSTNVIIGGTTTSAGNIVAYNKGDGIVPYSGSVVSIQTNSIHDNGGLGIDLGGDGVTANDLGDNDTGANTLQNFPIVASAIVSGTTTTIQGSINTSANIPLTIDFYSTPTLGPGSSAQGQTYIGSAAVVTDSSGNSTFKAKFSLVVPAGQYVTATATTTAQSPNGNTSEFSPPVQVAVPPTPVTPAVSIGSISQAEGNTGATSFKFPVTLSVAGTSDVSVQYVVTDGTATQSDGDYQAASGTLTIPAGQTSGTITVLVNGDTKVEPNETFTVTLSNPTNATIAVGSATGTITNDDVAPVGALSGSANTAASGYNLTTLGSNDWAKFGRNGQLGNFDHKATGSSQISNVTIVGSGNYGGYNDPARNTSWSDGSPTPVDSNDHGFLYANNQIGAGYSFTVPADKTSRTLYVYVGGFSSGSTLTAHLSDGSSPDYTATFSSAGKYNEIVSLTYSAASAGQKLTITYVKSQNINGVGGSADLMAAAITGAVVVDTTPPAAKLTSSSDVTTASNNPYTFAITYTDNVAVKASTLGHNEVIVTGPNGYSQVATLTSSGLADGPSVVATYSVAAPNGGFTNSANGSYSISVQPNQVSDTSGNFVPGGQIGTFNVNVPTPPPPATGGALSGSSVAAATSYNLTSLGTSDWAHWGRGASFTGFDHKKTGGSQISNVAVVGPNANVGGYNDPARNVTWTDGSPTSSDTNDHGFIYNNGAFGSGFRFTVAAGTASRRLYIYAGGFASGGTLTAHLSDGSAADFVATPSGSGKYNNLFTIDFSAASANQTLTITYIRTQQFSSGGSIDLMGAALA